MIWTGTLFLALLLQTPAAEKVTVGLSDGQKVVLESPEFSGIIQGRGSDTALIYRQEKLHGTMPINTISKIEFGEYQKGKPFRMTVTLKNGQKLELQSERHDFVSLKGKTDQGTVTINHPDPVTAPLQLGSKKPNRKQDLTIQYLEFAAS
jgi:hypothetical protein